MKVRHLVGVLSVLVSACAPSLYRPLGLDGGYAQTRLNADTFNVVFQGNAHTPVRTVENYALYRCAELTLESGFDHFVVLSANSDASQLFYGSPVSPQSTSSGSTPYGMVSVTIRAFKGAPPSGQAFSARDVVQTLAPGIKRE